MKQIASGRVAHVAAKYGEHAPMTAVCCNACRTCVTANIVALATAAAAATGAGIGQAFRRLTTRQRRA